jgi:V8-like Glu-specific endopeptidase
MTLLLAFSFVAKAQIQQQGEPLQWMTKTMDRASIPVITTAELDMISIQAEDAVVDQYKETPYRFGIEHEVNIDFFETAVMTEFPKGDKVWRMAVNCPDASSINFIFDQWNLPVGGRMTIWSADRSEFIGVFNHFNNKEYNSLAVGLVHSDEVILEYYEKSNIIGEAQINIGMIIHGYRPVVNKFEPVERGPFGNSGSCNMNVNCPDGSAWQAEKRGVALILNGGSAWCTGSLINNTSQNAASYFLTASHCNGTESNWVFYFNHETAGCTGSTGPTNQSISGGTQVATGSASDYHLVQLSSIVPSNYQPYYNGWDRSNSAVSTAVGIHHPAGDVKKISFDDDPLTKTAYVSNSVSASSNHWRVETWERSTTTEGGSSGSPLFDQNHRIIGQLHGGYAACGNTTSDWYGAFGDSWSGLSSYLDPSNTGAMTLDGFDPGAATATCSDGIQNQDETGIDCGGVCPNVCPTCDDGIQNGNETDIDCGGFDCAPCPCLGESIYLTLLLDNYPEETSWSITDANGGPISNGGTYGSEPDGSTLNIEVCVNVGCYVLTIYDTFGDGMCCGYGNGAYTLTSSTGSILASGAAFTNSEVTSFCIEGNTACQAPNTLDVVEIGFGTSNPSVNGTWVTPEGTAYCEVRGGRISAASYTAGVPEFVTLANTRVITQTNGSTVNFNVALYNNPNIPFSVGQRYGYDVRCACADGSGISEWANITPASTFIVPSPPAGVFVGNNKWLQAGVNELSVYPNPAEDMVNIQIDLVEEGSVELIMQNTLGQTVAQERSSGSSMTQTMDVSTLKAGVYMLSVRTSMGVISERLIIK